MKLGIIAGNRHLPVTLSKTIKQKNPQLELIAYCFYQETSPLIKKYADKVYWFHVGALSDLRLAIKNEGLSECIMAGQITPLRIFNRKYWDNELISLVEKTKDLRPHTIFLNVINYLEKEGIRFLDSTLYLKEHLAAEGALNEVLVDEEASRDIDFGTQMISRFADLDIGQTIVVKQKSVVALEALEGTDRAIWRGYKLAGKACVVLKFSKIKQDFRFDVPVVGCVTLKLLRKIKAKALVLEKDKVLILDKERFLALAEKFGIAVLGKARF
jgi:DUF1009 family protein